MTIKLNPKTAYLSGVIIGDGNLSNYYKSKTDKSKDYRIYIDMSDKEFVLYIEQLIKSIIKTKSSPKKAIQRGNRIPRLYLQIRNKELFYFLHYNMEIPLGNKSSIVIVPTKIKEASKEIKRAFLAGYFDTDGGFRSNSLGFTTASIKLNKGISELLVEFNICHTKDIWRNKRYDRDYYGIKIYKREIVKFLKTLSLQNKSKRERIYQRFSVGI